jgi:hypothetical protein
MPKYSTSEMKERNAFSQKMYHQFEGNMKDFLDYVPLDEDNLKVFSPKLVTLILDVGPELINAFDIAVNCTAIYPMWEEIDLELHDAREMLWEKEEKCREHNRSLTFSDYMSFLEKHYLNTRLSTQIVQLIELEAYFKPFELTNTSWANIEWWHTYNLLKHDKYSNRKKASLVSALKLLGALLCIINNNSNLLFNNTLQSSIFFPIGSRLNESFKKI